MKQYRLWIVLFFVALLLRLGMAFYWEHRNGADEFYFGDSDTYWVLGRAMAQGEPYVYDGKSIHRMPGYPVLLAPLFLVFGENPPIMAARVENVLIGSLTVLAVAWLALLLFGDKTIAFWAGLITAVDPLNIVMSVLVLSEAPFCLAMVLQIAFWVKALRATEKIDKGSMFIAGLLAAVTIYCRPSWLYFVPFATLAGIVLSPKNFRPIMKSGLIVTVIAAVCLVPWWIRNYRVSGHFVSTTLQAGPSLYDGLNPEATGGSDMSFVEKFRNAEMKLVPEGVDLPHKKLEYQLNKKMRQAAFDWAVKHPDLVWKLARSKFVRLWNIWPNEKTLSSTAVKIAVFCTYFPVLVLGVIGAFRSFGKGFDVRLLWIPAVYITLLHIVFVSSIRYRAPAMICLAVLAAWVLCDAVRALKTRKKNA